MGTMNDKRTDWAARAVDTFAQATGLDISIERDTAVKDLLCNLRHYCSAYGLDYNELDADAADLFQAEVGDDE